MHHVTHTTYGRPVNPRGMKSCPAVDHLSRFRRGSEYRYQLGSYHRFEWHGFKHSEVGVDVKGCDITASAVYVDKVEEDYMDEGTGVHSAAKCT